MSGLVFIYILVQWSIKLSGEFSACDPQRGRATTRRLSANPASPEAKWGVCWGECSGGGGGCSGGGGGGGGGGAHHMNRSNWF